MATFDDLTLTLANDDAQAWFAAKRSRTVGAGAWRDGW